MDLSVVSVELGVRGKEARSNETWVMEGVRDEAQPKVIEGARSKESWIMGVKDKPWSKVLD